MSFQSIRALIETRVNNAFQGIAQPIPVVFDNVGGEPPGIEYVELTIDYTSFTEPILCPTESGIEVIRGNLQMVIYSPRGLGMARIESLDAVALTVMNNLKDWSLSDPAGVKCQIGEVLGPVNVLSGDDPLAANNVSAPFLAYG